MFNKLKRYMYLRQVTRIKQDALRNLQLDVDYLLSHKNAKSAQVDVGALRVGLQAEQLKKEKADMEIVQDLATKIADRENTAKTYVNALNLCNELEGYIKLLGKWKNEIFK